MIWRYKTRKGYFYIVPMPGGFAARFEGANLDGPYRTPQETAYVIANGDIYWPDFDPSRLGIPEELQEWEYMG